MDTTNDSQKVSALLEPVPILSTCSGCGTEFPIEELCNLPETEKAYRMFALEKINLEELNAMHLDTDTLLCPECLEKLKKEHEEGSGQALPINT